MKVFIFFAIIFILLVAVSFWVYVSTIVIGIVILCIGNGISKALRGNFASIWWHILTVAVTVYSTGMLWKDIFDETVDIGSQPYIILIVYGIASLILLGVISKFKQSAADNTYAQKNNTHSYSKASIASESTSSTQIRFGSPSTESASPIADDLLSRLRENLTVERKIFDRYGLTFRFNLIKDHDVLQLNYELSNTKQLVSRISKGTGFTIKANVYDAENNLLCIEEAWVEYGLLKSGYAADYFYFSGDAMSQANSMRVYAIDPNEEDHDDDEDGTEIIPDEMKHVLLDESIAFRFNEILSDSLKLIEKTTYPKTFFGRYNDALINADKIYTTTHSEENKAYAREIIDDLEKNRDKRIIEFVDRCHLKGNLYSIKDELLSGQYDISPETVSYINELVAKIEAEEDEAPASGEYIYCSLSFSAEGKTYYYKTTDETLKYGDKVIVPIGNDGREGVAKIEKIERFKVGETPYPPRCTKNILGKCEY